MAGHSKWAQIKRKKADTDVKRGKAFSKIVKEISIAARLGGGDPGGNPRLRTAIEKAKEVNMPADNVKRAIQKGTGELPGTNYEESVYEGYGPGGVALLIDVLTDNKNRTVSEIRHLLSKHGGNMGESGCVAWMFEKKGYLLIHKEMLDEEALMGIVLDAGAEDLKNNPNEENYEVITLVEDFMKVKEALEGAGLKIEMAEITMIPKNTIYLDEQNASRMLKLMEILEDHDDVQNVYANFDVADEVMQRSI